MRIVSRYPSREFRLCRSFSLASQETKENEVQYLNRIIATISTLKKILERTMSLNTMATNSFFNLIIVLLIS